jgi:hypothetical protein
MQGLLQAWQTQDPAMTPHKFLGLFRDHTNNPLSHPILYSATMGHALREYARVKLNEMEAGGEKDTDAMRTALGLTWNHAEPLRSEMCLPATPEAMEIMATRILGTPETPAFNYKVESKEAGGLILESANQRRYAPNVYVRVRSEKNAVGEVRDVYSYMAPNETEAQKRTIQKEERSNAIATQATTGQENDVTRLVREGYSGVCEQLTKISQRGFTDTNEISPLREAIRWVGKHLDDLMENKKSKQEVMDVFIPKAEAGEAAPNVAAELLEKERQLYPHSRPIGMAY